MTLLPRAGADDEAMLIRQVSAAEPGTPRYHEAGRLAVDRPAGDGMAVPFGVPKTGLRLPAHRRVLPLVAVGMGGLLARLPPEYVAKALRAVRPGAVPATYAQALDARNAVTSVSSRCASIGGCLQRSLATALLSRMRGVWVDWCTGVRAQPFRAHAWVEAEFRPVAEPREPGYYQKTMVVSLKLPQRRGTRGHGGR